MQQEGVRTRRGFGTMTVATCETVHSAERTNGATAYVIAGLVSLALGVSYIPFQDASSKFQLLVILTGLVALLAAPRVGAILKNGRLLTLYLLSALFLSLCYLHSIHNPPLTEYADRKLLNLLYSI